MGGQTTSLLLLGYSLLVASNAPAEARPSRDLRQVNESLPPGQSITDVVTSLVKTVRALVREIGCFVGLRLTGPANVQDFERPGGHQAYCSIYGS